jgi:maleylpyruvate isomerase
MAGRTDNVSDPELAARLLLARRGQAYFSRKLHELRDEDFDKPSLLPGWSRRTVAAHVGLNARAVSRLVQWAATGVETPMYDSPTQRDDEIEFGATLPIQAIRNLSDHAAVHLNVEWRDLPEERWSAEVVTAQGRTVPVSETVWMRTREVWLHAVDLDNGARVEQFPPELIPLLLEDLVKVWRRKGSPQNILMEPIDREETYRISDAEPDLVVRGTSTQLVAWGTGRGGGGVLTPDGAPAPKAPGWL